MFLLYFLFFLGRFRFVSAGISFFSLPISVCFDSTLLLQKAFLKNPNIVHEICPVLVQGLIYTLCTLFFLQHWHKACALISPHLFVVGTHRLDTLLIQSLSYSRGSNIPSSRASSSLLHFFFFCSPLWSCRSLFSLPSWHR